MLVKAGSVLRQVDEKRQRISVNSLGNLVKFQIKDTSKRERVINKDHQLTAPRGAIYFLAADNHVVTGDNSPP